MLDAETLNTVADVLKLKKVAEELPVATPGGEASRTATLTPGDLTRLPPPGFR